MDTNDKKKVDYIIEAIHENWGDIFVYADVDIQFFEPFLDIIVSLMHDKDLLIQKNSPQGTLCSGFFACRANEKTLQLWRHVRLYMDSKEMCSDQESLNHYLNKKHNLFSLAWDYLPDSFFGAGIYTGKQWHPGMILELPNLIIMHHANYTKGIKNKIKQLRFVQEIVQAKKISRVSQ